MAGDGYRVGVMGATGAVGTTILALLHERGFPAREVVAYASERSAVSARTGCGTAPGERTRDTVAIETPAALATSVIVATRSC